ncbi:hypothetical protein BaRGS_00022840 [Batillaria attramentaria]|uniref:Uncharacterized protein n=1 Tax=Batillaria attramentaria TaxID=370345 RepID=A0ABD0KFM0_9CAEN
MRPKSTSFRSRREHDMPLLSQMYTFAVHTPIHETGTAIAVRIQPSPMPSAQLTNAKYTAFVHRNPCRIYLPSLPCLPAVRTLQSLSETPPYASRVLP